MTLRFAAQEIHMNRHGSKWNRHASTPTVYYFTQTFIANQIIKYQYFMSVIGFFCMRASRYTVTVQNGTATVQASQLKSIGHLILNAFHTSLLHVYVAKQHFLFITDYEFILEPYKGSSTRYECPSCEKPFEFTRYIDIETNENLADNVGICNRRGKCGYHYPPNSYFTDNSSVKNSEKT